MAKTFVLITLSVLLFSCNSSEDVDLGYAFAKKIDTLDMESFKFPDSIDTKLIIATYYDEENKIQSLFVFSDALKKSAKKIDFFKNDSVVVDTLSLLKLNEFRSRHLGVDYVIGKKTITIIDSSPMNHTKPRFHSISYKRTDRD